jgi:hypothetical protein
MPYVMWQNSLEKESVQSKESRKSLWLDSCSLNQGGVSPLWFNQIGKMTMRLNTEFVKQECGFCG